MSAPIWNQIQDLFEMEGFDYAIRYKGLPYVSNKKFIGMIERYKKLADEIESYVEGNVDWNYNNG